MMVKPEVVKQMVEEFKKDTVIQIKNEKQNTNMIFKFIKNIGVMFAGVLLATVAFAIYYMASNSDVIGKALTNPEEIRAMYTKCKVEKVYMIK